MGFLKLLLSGTLILLVPAGVLMAICWRNADIRQSRDRWALAFKTAPLGGLAAVVFWGLWLMGWWVLFRTRLGESIYFHMPESLRWLHHLVFCSWIYIPVVAAAVGGGAAVLIQRKLLPRAGIDPAPCIVPALVTAAMLVVVMFAVLSLTHWLYSQICLLFS